MRSKTKWEEVTGKHNQFQEKAATKWNAGVAGGESLWLSTRLEMLKEGFS